MGLKGCQQMKQTTVLSLKPQDLAPVLNQMMRTSFLTGTGVKAAQHTWLRLGVQFTLAWHRFVTDQNTVLQAFGSRMFFSFGTTRGR